MKRNKLNPLTKRQMRDGISSKVTAKKTTSNNKKNTKRTPHNMGHNTDVIEVQKPHKVRVNAAKKLVVRHPNQKIQECVRDFKEKRFDIAKLEPIRLQKALASSGIGSRREMEQWIEQGLVCVNGKVAHLGDKIQANDEITVRGKVVNIKWPDRLPRIILYYKQEGEIVSRDDPQGRVSIFDRLPQTASSRWVSIGRLDINTSGLLIVTTSGALVNRFAHPSFEVEREYAVRILGQLTDAQKDILLKGVLLDDGITKVANLSEQGGDGANKWYNIVLKEGKNREVRRIFESQGYTVSRLIRVRFGPISLPARLKRGQYYELNQFEVANIMRWAHLPIPN